MEENTSRQGKVPHEKINRCLTDINQCLTDIFKFNRYLTDTENQFYKISVISVKYQFVLVISVKYRFIQISTLMIFNRYLTNTNQYILETNTISKIG